MRPLTHPSMALLLTWGLGAACVAPKDDPDGSAGSRSPGEDTGAWGDTGDTGNPGEGDEAPWYCAEGSYTVEDGVVETEHYRLTLELDEAEALQMARLAEAAYAAFTAYFGAEPEDAPLRAGWYADAAAFRAALEADGVEPPDAGGYYWTGTRTAYLYTQPTLYYSRVLFLHELSHQFHALARTGNEVRDGWYSEGFAEYISRHDWDGDCVRLGRLPMLTWEDYPAIALAEGSLDFDGAGDLSRPWAWAVYRYLQEESPAAFDAFRAAYDADGSVALSDHVDVDATVSAVEAWLPTAQEPMTPIYLDWIHVTEGVVQGEAPYFSMAVSKGGDTFRASHDAVDGYAGIVAAYDDANNFSAWLVGSDGGLWTFVATEGEALWWHMDDAPEGPVFDWQLSGTTVTVNGVSYEETNGFTPRGGVALYGTTAVLTDISP